MLLKRVKLLNIRSYVDEEIVFPEGSLLLSGDIGSGKSTILYAVDFAFFGITDDLSGGSLLRHGSSEGRVELEFELDGKTITLSRSLKRGSSVTQGSGWIEIDGVKRELTAQELKQKVLELFQYPQELLTKKSTKSMIYRYTVYTPQDEMKSILLGDEQVRVDTLRKVFGIDAYKVIRDNAEVFLKSLRVRMKMIEEDVRDGGEKREKLIVMKKQFEEMRKELAPLVRRSHELQRELEEISAQLRLLEKDVLLFHEQQKELTSLDTGLVHYRQDEERVSGELRMLTLEIGELEKTVKGRESVSGEQVKHLDEKLRRVEDKIQQLRLRKQNSLSLIALREQTIAEMSKVDVCPLCKQKVDQKHVKQVVMQEQRVIDEQRKIVDECEEEELVLGELLERLRGELEQLRLRVQDERMIVYQKHVLEEKKTRVGELENMLRAAKLAIERGERNRVVLLGQMERLRGKDVEIQRVRERSEQVRQEERGVLMEKIKCEKECSVLERDVDVLERDLDLIAKKEKVVRELRLLHEWMGGCFVPMAEKMEQQVLLKVHADFDSFFQKWFDMLMGGELMRVRLDESFHPVIEQNGYETDYVFLSGGEKTAGALAYRLALNQVVTSLVGLVKTRDVVILDEPTDGFSREQLERMRIVLDELDAKQVILVSHEDAIEGFVDSVIRIEKQEHVSRVVR